LRLPPVDSATASEPVRELLTALPELSLFGVVAHADSAFGPWLSLGGSLLSGLSLTEPLRELVILQVATSMHSDYERVQHEVIGAGVGLSPAQIAAVVQERLDDPAVAQDAPVLRVVKELVDPHTTTTEGFELLRARLSPREIVELLLVVGYYVGVALLVAAVDLEPDLPAEMAVVDAATGRNEASR
jgi:4-carboxymuconolactone decarboxylase